MNDAKNVSAGKPKITGAIHVAPLGAPLPTTPTEELDASFRGLGYCSDAGLTNGTNLEVTKIKAWGGDTVLIIDAKYYAHTTQAQYDIRTLHSGNLYQIFTYVKNKDSEFGDKSHTVSGMLLYAATDEAVQPDNSYQMSGNKISVRTLDLNQDFSEISAQLNAIVNEHFDVAIP